MKRIFLVIVVSFVLFSLYGNSPKDEIETYLNEHYVLKEAANQIAEISLGRKRSVSLLIPSDMNLGISGAFSSSDPEIAGQVSLSYTLLDVELIKSLNDTELLIEASKENWRWVRQSLLYELLKTIINVFEKEELLSLVDKRVISYEETTESVQKRYDLGVISRTELDVSLLELSLAEAERIVRESEHDKAQQLVDLNLDNLALMRNFLGMLPSQLPEVQNEELMEKRADLQQAVILVKSIDDQKEDTKSQFIPDLKLSAGAYNLFTDTPQFRISLSTPIPIRAFSTVKTDREALDLEKGAALMRIDFLSEQIVKDIEILRLEYESLCLQEDAYTRVETSAQSALDGAEKEFTAGIGSLYQLIDMRNRYFDAQSRLSRIRLSKKKILLDYLYQTGDLKLERIQFGS